MAGEQRPTKQGMQLGGNTYDFTTLDDYIKRLMAGEKKAVEAAAKIAQSEQDDRIKKEERDTRRMLEELASFKQILEDTGMKSTQAAQEQWLKQFENQKKIAEEKQLQELYKTQSRQYQKRQAQELKAEQKRTEIAKLRSTIDAQTGEVKSKSQLRRDEFKANILEFGQKFGEELSNKFEKSLLNLSKALTNAVDQSISSVVKYQTNINTRLQGIYESTNVFKEVEKTLSKVAYSPLLNAEDLYANLNELVSEGIAQNVEQRAFLQTIKDGIATTFDANNSALRRIIRLQQQDSTAARLGMEAYLTAYLNELTQNTEYLKSTFDSVAENLLNASALMSSEQATEFEYIVQKWLGALTGVGLSDSTATAIAQALGQLGSGDISSLSGSSIQNLLVMAASRVGLDYGNLLSGGLTGDTVNQLLYGMFRYMSEIGQSNSNVVKSQYASTFGVNISDLVAAKNIFEDTASLQNLYSNALSYTGMYNELADQMDVLSKRLPTGQIIDNLFKNFAYQQGANIASSPILMATWKITDLIEKATGGINIPYISALGTGVDLEATVEQLMKLGIVGASTLGGIGNIVSGLTSLGKGSNLLNAFTDIRGLTRFTRGSGLGVGSNGSQVSTSLSTIVGNYEGSAYQEGAIAAASEGATVDPKIQELDEQSKEAVLSIDEILTETISVDIKETNKILERISNALSNGSGELVGLTGSNYY